MSKIRNLLIVLGDQLNHDSSIFDGFDNQVDRIWMAENQQEATHVWSHQYRLVAFFSPMRHFRDELREAGREVLYHELPRDGRVARTSSFSSLLGATLGEYRVDRLVVVQPGDHRVLESLRETAGNHEIHLEIRPDRYFYCSPEQFAHWAQGRKSLVLESFYRMMRTEHGILVDADGNPDGGQWNYDQENRGHFPRTGPGPIPEPPRFEPDEVTRQVISMVGHRFADHPGHVDEFDLPVTRTQAIKLLDDFIANKLARFGEYQDAMWSDRRFLYHSRLSHALNLHLLSPDEVVQAAVAAYREDQAPLAAVEGFVRQLLGWREYVRGVYWLKMPGYESLNALDCDPQQDVPSFYWDGNTEMSCVRDAMRLLVDTGYAHHIQRLMVLGLYAQLHGVHPLKFHQWHMAMYADAVDWVSLPNALGMSQYGDGGLMATKPYCASGNYIHRMSNHCQSCRYRYDRSTGDNACPFTTLYWDFLDRHRDTFQSNHRMAMQLKNLDRRDPDELKAIRIRAKQIRSGQLTV